MVFSSLPFYLDPPNWQQQQQQPPPPQHLNRIQQQTNGYHDNPQLIQPPQQVPHMENFTSGCASNTNTTPTTALIRPSNSVLAERACLAKIAAQPDDGPLKCPRCDSINTKFCYFNNYNFSQPRHFCKTCRRYWTRGGALRNVPVGGGFRRNKRSKSNQSKSNARSGINRNSNATGTADERLVSTGSVLPSSSSSSGGCLLSRTPQMSFMASLQNLGLDFQAGGLHPHQLAGGATNRTMASTSGTQYQMDHEFGTFTTAGGGRSSSSPPLYLSMQLQEPTRDQFPFTVAAASSGFHEVASSAAGLYPYPNEDCSVATNNYGSGGGRMNMNQIHHQNEEQLMSMVRSNCNKAAGTTVSITTSSEAVGTQNVPVKMEDQNSYTFHKLLLSMSTAGNTNRFWSNNITGSSGYDPGSNY